MNRVLMAVGAISMAGLMSGCLTAKEKIAEEYNRITTLPPPVRVVCGCDRALDDLAGAVCDARLLAQKNLTAYVSATENHREYVGFMNDVAALVQDEGLTEEAAVARIKADIVAADASLPDEEKVWPRVVEGIIAVEALEPEVVLKELAVATLRNAELILTASELKNSFNGFDATTISKALAAKDVALQASETAECLAFLTEQYRRVLVAKTYSK